MHTSITIHESIFGWKCCNEGIIFSKYLFFGKSSYSLIQAITRKLLSRICLGIKMSFSKPSSRSTGQALQRAISEVLILGSAGSVAIDASINVG